MRTLRPTELTDHQLFVSMRKGDEGAYYALFERYWERLYSIASRLSGDAEFSKDAVQDVFLSFWERRMEIGDINVGAYLVQATKFRVYKQLRDGKMSEAYTNFLKQQPRLSRVDVFDHVSWQEELETHIEALPERCREVFRLSRLQELSNREIAEKLGLSQRTVETHISNALRFLRKQMKSENALLLGIALIG